MLSATPQSITESSNILEVTLLAFLCLALSGDPLATTYTLVRLALSCFLPACGLVATTKLTSLRTLRRHATM